MRLEVESYIEKKGDQDVNKMGLSNFSQVKFYSCGKLGHVKRDCRAPGGGAHNPNLWNGGKGGKSKTSPFSLKGKGKGKHNIFEGYCSNCWRWGHKATDYPVLKGKGKRERLWKIT